MDNLIKASIVITALIIGSAIMYGLIYLFNQLLYQIMVHPGRTLIVIGGIWVVYGIYHTVKQITGKTNL